MKIQIYGSGCDKCKRLYANAEEAVKSAGIEAEIEKVTDMNAIVEAGILMTPALSVDGRIVASGKVLSPAEILPLLGEAPAEPSCGGGSGSCCCGGGTRKPVPVKRIVAVLLLAFVLGSVAWAFYRENTAKPAPAAAPVSDKALTVYYFHGTQRCMTCNRIEELTRTALESKFAAELKAGNIVFRSVNVDNPADEHFIRDFALDSKIVVMRKDGKVEKFPAVWTLVHDPEKFAAYIQSGVEQFR